MSSSPDQPPAGTEQKVFVEFCQRTHGCPEGSRKILRAVLDPSGFAAWQIEEIVDAKIGTVNASIGCSGCLGICEEKAAALVTIGNHQTIIAVDSADDLRNQLETLMRRKPEDWTKEDTMTPEQHASFAAAREREAAERLTRRREMED